MPNILEQIAAATRERVARDKEQTPAPRMRELAAALAPAPGSNPASFPFEAGLRGPGLGFICEVKKASPSKGIIAEDFPYLDIARSYEAAGAEAMSVLTEPQWFLGSDRYLEEIARTVTTPCLRKDFVVDSYQIYQAKVLGASAVLLICSLLDAATLREYLELAHSLGLSALVETHDAAEIDSAQAAGARIIGINNRNLKDFSVDLTTAGQLRARIGTGALVVAESGVRGAADVEALAAGGADAVLVGEALMRSADKVGVLAQWRQAAARVVAPGQEKE
ncbi:indole-3-glycerol phosphate synthase TrpC [Actinotignum sanguinis]|uniref:Indole-3-glycerol phosphate synthase n=2 Tax=Actinomycetaceae TaxID=2049 RepID=A0ABZ0RBP6_9ACTO|nr:indole-3-glycerol phosphate synthase TrpC [Actinotignum sanguinis]WPJ88167.1 indole-3-glycerol phosphate synthase TrpC [Schaalia turicensis]MDE1552646.1 indole-3-glycerol phosphate synthase TrpC [Actinotignum sanguinis]MDE1656269.1 indole-3-glycerol phosphate synthase TrpC [Actinotignum sanguinis]MDK7198385.1 indole-3-glycerol phosphate synthase TrpC [Actinotignum sanguinis]MDK8512063.1 indole-3-glycerol phosphate synthase TrpC [Actinotignum sanguinis]